MSKLSSALAAAAALALSSLAAAPASALVALTFVSGKGVDAGACATPASACRTFQYAHNQTISGGEIKALDPAQYGSFVITKSISVTGVEGASVVRAGQGVAIVINAGAGGVVNLSNLTIDGFNRAATVGILLNSAASLTISHCTVRNFYESGIFLLPTSALKFLIADAVATGNRFYGVSVFPKGAGSAKGVLDHVAASGNDVGVYLSTEGGAVNVTAVDVTAVDSVASDNASSGFIVNRGFASSGATLRLAHSTATRNVHGVTILSSTARSAGDNFIDGNTSNDVVGALTNVGTK